MAKVAKTAPKRVKGGLKAKDGKSTTKARKTAKKSIKTAFNDYFIKLDQDEFVDLCRKWNNANLKIDLPDLANYDDWLNYFKTLSPNAVSSLATTAKDVLPIEGYAALTRWYDIIKNPHRIDKIHQAGLSQKKDQGEKKSITELAAANDQIGVLRALRDEVAEKLERGTGARDTASLARELGAIMEQIDDAERKAGPKSDTVLGKLLGVNDVKTTTKKKTGVRKGRYAAKLTVEDMD